MVREEELFAQKAQLGCPRDTRNNHRNTKEADSGRFLTIDLPRVQPLLSEAGAIQGCFPATRTVTRRGARRLPARAHSARVRLEQRTDLCLEKVTDLGVTPE